MKLDVDLPGFNKDEIKLELNNGYLTISTEKSLSKENKGKMLHQERYVGTMQRSFYVGGSITEEDTDDHDVACWSDYACAVVNKKS